MAADPRVLRQAERTGMGALTAAQGLGALASILSTPMTAAQPQSQFAAMSVNWSIIIKQVLSTHMSSPSSVVFFATRVLCCSFCRPQAATH